MCGYGSSVEKLLLALPFPDSKALFAWKTGREHVVLGNFCIACALENMYLFYFRVVSKVVCPLHGKVT